MSALSDLHDAKNIERAWRWIKSNPDARYKIYFRDLYSIYDIAAEPLLNSLRERLRRKTYEPSVACKLYFPKASGVLRPYTLLTVEDQIAYQAAVNVVADRLLPRVRSRYLTDVFGHLYAGRSSTWFYRKWNKGYQQFNEMARQAFGDGYRYAASFDLTACYDSLDHGVLCHFLKKIGCEQEFCSTLTQWLGRWTATDHLIYHNHGIPQGPLSSGLLSEVVLQHFDANRGRPKTVRYFRYVDDIRLFAKTEKELRLMLVRLDKLSKDIGLFPQSSKIAIHKVSDIEEELKSVSHPVEESIAEDPVDQVHLRRRLVELSPRYKVTDGTRFRFLLARAKPHSTVISRLWRIYDTSPEYYTSLARHIERYSALPPAAARALLDRIVKQDLYPAIAADFIRVIHGRLKPAEATRGDALLKKLWQPRSTSADLMAYLGSWLISRGQLTFRQTEYACLATKAWWPRATLFAALSDTHIGEASLSKLANEGIRDSSDDVALSAAMLFVRSDICVEPPRRDLNSAAAALLKEFGIIRRGVATPCSVERTLAVMSGATAHVDWRQFFGQRYRHAERQIVECRGLATTNATAWVNGMDVFLDLVLAALYTKDTSLGTYMIGSIGSVYGSTRLKASYPKLQALIESVHLRRYSSHLSHATQKRSGKPTGAVPFRYLRMAHKLVQQAVSELAHKY